MRMYLLFGLAVVAGVATRARADHHGMAMSTAPERASDFGASVSFVAARFDTMNYVGAYQGVVASAGWTHDRFGVSLTAPLYHLSENGASFAGIGDVAVMGRLGLVATDRGQLGVTAMVSAPTGNGYEGLGMGHAMAMPALYGTLQTPVSFAASFGYSRALATVPSDHDHGVWPLVDPMNMSELSWSASGDLPLTGSVLAGVHLSGGIPVGHLPGHTRVIGAARVAYGHGRLQTTLELQAGLAGDPFTLRGVLETALRF